MDEENEKLTEHSGEFNKKEVITLVDNIHVAIGYGLGRQRPIKKTYK